MLFQNGSLYFLVPSSLLSPLPWPSICVYRSWSQICVYQPWPSTCIYIQVKILLLPQLLVLSLPPPPPLLLLLIIITTKDTFAAVKSALNDPLNVFDEKINSCFSKFVSAMANVSLKREAAVVIGKIAYNCRIYQND